MAVSESIRVIVEPTSEVAALLRKAEASGRPMIVEAGDDSYIVHVESRTLASLDLPHATEEEKQSLWADYDSERSRAIPREVEGSWADVDADQLIADVYRWRDEVSRPVNRL